MVSIIKKSTHIMKKGKRERKIKHSQNYTAMKKVWKAFVISMHEHEFQCETQVHIYL